MQCVLSEASRPPRFGGREGGDCGGEVGWTSSYSASALSSLFPAVCTWYSSATLHHWQQLAQPHLGGILDPRPGVVTKGFRTLDVDLDEVYCLNDFEEDDTEFGTYLPMKRKVKQQKKEADLDL
ncbi:hypothetical protein E2I00_006541 [Balaenoptera physalus]|uniref:Uncharacterized protein n=1 Tax=Balaenoptera physalus TaxID=9770 RepID=A0A643C0K7_BALPH|nr:hypothetical protein E2I00_006541 [Balaenoptera physalus]